MIGPSVKQNDVAPTIQRIVDVYRCKKREDGERFIGDLPPHRPQAFQGTRVCHFCGSVRSSSDEWADAGADAALPADDVALIVPFAKFQGQNPGCCCASRKGKLGIRLSPADKVEEPAAGSSAAVAGRRSSSPAPARAAATRRRNCFGARYQFAGEVRAVGM